MKLTRIVLTWLMAVTTVCAVAAERQLSKVTVHGEQFYVYDVKKGDTMYGISHDLGWNTAVMQVTNPGMLSPLQKGARLYYPIFAKTDTVAATPSVKKPLRKGETKHTVKPGETLYGLGKTYNVSVAAIMEANPGVSENNFRAGATIKIPREGEGLHPVMKEVEVTRISGFRHYKVKKSESWAAIARNNNVSIEDVMAANEGVKLKNGNLVGIPVFSTEIVNREIIADDPRAQSEEGLQEIYEEVHGIAGEGEQVTLRIAVLLDNGTTMHDKEFLRGFLTGVDKMKNSGMKLDIKVLEGNNDGELQTGILRDYAPTMVINTTENKLPSWLNNYALANKVHVVNVLDVKDENYQSNPYVIQLVTPPDYFNRETAEWVKRNYEGNSLVFVGDEDSNDQLAQELKALWDPAKMRSRKVSDLETLPLAANGRYLMYCYDTKKAEMTEFLKAANGAASREPMAEVTVIGRPNWIIYDTDIDSKYSNINVNVPSRFYIGKSEAGNSFNLAFRQLFGRNPVNSFPEYAAVGYDTALYFLKGLAKNGGNFNDIPECEELVQSDYSLKRPDNWSGSVNTGTFMVRFTSFGTVDKITVK